MLNEHVEALAQKQFERNKKEKPILDDQQYEEFAYVIERSMLDGTQVKVILFDEYEDKALVGTITNIDTNYRRIKLQMEDDFDWIKLDDITNIFLI